MHEAAYLGFLMLANLRTFWKKENFLPNVCDIDTTIVGQQYNRMEEHC